MTLRGISTTLILSALTVGALPTAPALAQSGGAATASVADLQRSIDALDTMNATVGPMVLEATARTNLMQRFISEQGFEYAWKQYIGSTPAPVFQGLTFEQAYDTALKKQALAAPSAPSSESVDDLQQDLNATMTLVQSAWNRVNTLHEQVGQLTAFLKQQNIDTESYLAWAEQEQKNIDADQAAKRAADEQKDAAIKANTAHQEALRQAWDEQQYAQNSSDMQPNMAVGEGQHGLANPDPSIQYTDRPLNGYFGGTYYNGYADPYYDVYGYRRAGGVTNVNIDNHYDCWNRYHGPAGPGTAPAPRLQTPVAGAAGEVRR